MLESQTILPVTKAKRELLEILKAIIEKLRENPYSGKSLERELSGYLSMRAKRFRVIYKIKDNDQTIEIHYVGHRKDIYELFKETVAK